jgi:hypothetical protein
MVRYDRAGIKNEEYREAKSYWHSRLQNKKYDAVKFKNGYAKDARSMAFKLDNLRTGTGKEEWGAPSGKTVYILHLGERL